MNWYGHARTCDQERRRTQTKDSVDDGYTKEREGRATENKMERRVPTKLEKYSTDTGEEMDIMATWSGKIISHTLNDGNKQGEKKKMKKKKKKLIRQLFIISDFNM